MLKVVVDTNKVIAALLREGRVRRVLLHPGLELLLPERKTSSGILIKIGLNVFEPQVFTMELVAQPVRRKPR